MANVREGQLRLLYSLLRIAARIAARFHIPMRTISELLRLAYYEVLRHQGLTQAEVGRRLGQTDRHMRTAAQKLRSDFFAAERELGLVREIEALVSEKMPMREELPALLPGWSEPEVMRALHELLAENRVATGEDGRLSIGARYILLASDQFHRRIDALDHFLDGVHQAVMHRLVHDDRRTAMIKTITFGASPIALEAFMTRLEGELRREIAALEEQALFEGGRQQRYTIGMNLGPTSDLYLDEG